MCALSIEISHELETAVTTGLGLHKAEDPISKSIW